MQTLDHPVDREPERFFPGDSEMARRMRAFDWSKTPLGPTESWSPALRTVVRLMLANRLPMLLWWGPQYISIYNDPYRPVLGNKHPWGLGLPVSECWQEIWHVLKPLIDTPFQGGPATWDEDILLVINRYGFNEETHWLIAYSPVPDESVPRGIGGVLATVHETTEKVLSERRMTALHELGSRPAEAKTAEVACAAAKALGAHGKDIPFALLYLTDADGKRAHLEAATGVSRGRAISPQLIDLDGGTGGWPVSEARRTMRPQVVTDLAARFRDVPPGPWPDPPTTAVVLPIASGNPHEPAGFLVAGVSSRLRLDDAYRAFFDLIAGHLAAAVMNARAHEEEQRRAEALAELDRAKTAFFSNVSHEFRTPLTLLLGPVEDALADPAEPLPPGQRERLGTVHRSGLRLLKLVNTLLDFSRIEAGRVQAVYEPTDLAALTGELASSFRSACAKAGLRLAVDCPPLPEPVYVDRDMWEKVVLNLLSNAFKFTLEGGIEVRLRAAAGAAELTVRDTGTGIPAGELPRVFERFHRVEGSRGRTHEGTGIGLALVLELVKLHGGSVRADSAPGRGSTFSVSVPTGTAHLPANRIGAARTLRPTATGADAFVEEALRWLPDEETSRSFPDAVGNAREAFPPEGPVPRLPPRTAGREGDAAPRPRILWADDNADMRDYVRRLLGPRYDVEAVADGEAALAAARARPPELVLTDVMMPRLDGFGLLAALRADPRTRTTPVILLSARAGEESRVEGLQAGADDYLVKPFSARELLARVSAHVEMNRLRREAFRREQELLAEAREAKQRLATVLQGISDGFVALDRDWRYAALNDRACEGMGMNRNEILGRSIWDLYPDNLGTPFETELRRAAAEQRTVTFEYFYPTRDRWYENRVYPSADGVSIFFADITDRKHAEDALRVAGERLDLAMRGSNLGIWDLDLAPRGDYRRDPVRFINIWEHLGYEPAEFPLDAAASRGLGHPDDLPRVDAAVAACLAGEKEEISVENRVRHKDGSYHWLLTLGRAMRDASGRPVRLIGTVLDVTERKRAEAALRESEERFRRYFELGLIGMAITSPTKGCLDVNDEICRILGYPREELLHKTWAEMTHPDDLAAAVAQFERVLAGEIDGYTMDKRWVRKDGRVIDTTISVRCVRDGDGSVKHFLALLQDVTEHRRAAEALRASEGRFRALAENVPSLVWTCTLDKRCDYANPQFLRYTGQSEAELLGDWRLDNIHPDDHAAMFAAWEHSTSTGRPAEFEARVRRHDGAWRWFQIRAAPVRDERGRLVKWFGANTDIDDLKRAEEALRASEERLAADLTAMKRLQQVSTRLVRNGDTDPPLEEIVDAAIAVTGADMGNIHLPDHATGRLRIAASRGFARPFLEFFGTVPEGRFACGAALQSGERVVIGDVEESPVFAGPALEVMRAAGARAVQSTPLFGRSGRLVGMLSTHYRAPRLPAERDLRVLDLLARQAADWIERTQTEEALRQAKEAAEAANRAKDQFLANVSHEIRTPFGAILGMTELVLDTPLSDEQRECLETARSAAGSLLGIVNDLLDFAKIEAGKLELDPADFSLRAAVGDAVRPLTARARQKGLDLLWDADPGVPDAVVGDAGRLRQVLINLIGNAIKFTERGEVVVRVEEDGPPAAGEVTLRFTVRDTGKGIARDKQDKIFAAFEQEDTSTTRRYGGTGLGLAIAARLVALTGGTIGVDSEPGRGSTFTFTARFGRRPGVAGPAAPRPVEEEPSRPEAPAAPLRVLVAEDNEFNARLLRRLLDRRGHSVRLAADGREALAALEQTAFDVAILDLQMPELDGLEIVREIRRRERAAGGHLPVIALTARARGEVREQCLAAGMDDYLSKPVGAAELLAAIERAAAGGDVPRPVEPRPAGGPGLLDAAALLAACDGHAEGLRELCKDFRSVAPAHLAETVRALRDGDAPRLREAAHKLCGMLPAFCGAAAAVASDAEDHAAVGRLDAAAPLVRRLESMIRELLREVDGASLAILRPGR